ncbi:mechanosensitive ion channel family protein [uncultured Nevskia sp.]|uniref:mechanosensitive ion channel family protein n=1 Tax=uncultured Nevskia sp. TaxID=228950 RepID=UPI0025CC7671|nr:mechanosensitive ion channel family protein [uncultured Nevskia sp.]
MNDLISYLSTLDRVLVRNPLSDWLVAVAVALAIVLVVFAVQRLLIRWLSNWQRPKATKMDPALINAVESTKLWLIVFVALYFGSQYLELGKKTALILDRIVTAAVLLQVGMWLGAMLDFWVAASRVRAEQHDVGTATSLSALNFIGKLLLWLVMLLFILDNLGINVTALVASLGIGGIAVALAVQNILGDLFASLSIVVDKPFVIGDAMAVDGFSGTVEHVGLKTTRLRADTGEQLIFSNSDLLKARLRNYKRMHERRVVMTVDVEFATPVDVVEKIPGMLRDIVSSQQKTRVDRAHLRALVGGAYQFELVYWMIDPAYGLYMDTRQQVLLTIVRRFEADGIRFSFPYSGSSRELLAAVAQLSVQTTHQLGSEAPEGKQ